ncbi:olfactory receptor 1571-like [Polyodon spathula]|uniref:olfactory receptor 1571-like n=1 Tax=Polyodon spathula TaxID=7913 RepID=UPI001B7DB6FA|nr:olfactory receptor 1571-like [Polyodon spathula]
MDSEHNETYGVVLLGFIYSADERGLIVPSLVFLLFLGVSANLLIIFIIYSKSYLRTPKNILICNLCAVDLYGIITTCPYFIIKFVMGDFSPMNTKLCLMQYYFYVVYSCLSVFIVTLMAVDRYYVICNPFEYEMKITNKRVVLSLAVSWVFAFFYPMLYAFSYIGHESCRQVLSCSFMCTGSSLEESMCTPITFQRFYRIFMFTFHLAACVVMVGFSYVKILKESRSARLSESSRKALSTVVTHSIVLAIFFITSLLLIVTGSLTTNNDKEAIALIRISTDLIYFSVPTSFNPVIYGLRNDDMRKELLKLLRRKKHTNEICSATNRKGSIPVDSRMISRFFAGVSLFKKVRPTVNPVIKAMPPTYTVCR